MRNSLKVTVCAGLCVLLLATAGQAKREKIGPEQVPFPGVTDDVPPELDFGNTGEGEVKGSINLKNNRFTVTGRGLVPNASLKKFQLKKGQFEFPGFEGLEEDILELKKASYTVAKPKKTIKVGKNKEPNEENLAKARLVVAGTANLPI